MVLILVLVTILVVVIRRRRGTVNNAENRQNRSIKRGHDGRDIGRSGNQSSTHRSNYDQSRGTREAGVATVPGRQEGGIVGRRATQSVIHKQPRYPLSRQTSLPVTYNPSQSAVFAPRGHGNDDAYQHLTPDAESTYQPLGLDGDGATRVQLSPDAKGAKFQPEKVTRGGDTRQSTTKQDEAKDNIYQELL